MTRVDTRLVVIGGTDGRIQNDNVHVFDTEDRVWSQPQTQGIGPFARIGHTAVYFNTKIYIFGGYGADTGYVADVHILDLDTVTWSRPEVSGADKPDSRVGHTANVFDKAMWVFGGGAGPSKNFNDMFRFDMDTCVWELLKEVDGLLPAKRYGHSSTEINGKLYIYGGSDGNKIHQDMQVFDLIQKSWTQPQLSGTIPSKRYRHVAAYFPRYPTGARLIAFGGVNGGSGIYICDPGEEDEATRLARLRAQEALTLAGAGDGEDAASALARADRIRAVTFWLQEMELGKYSQLFRKHEVDFTSLSQLKDQDLKDMGVEALGPRRRIMAAIRDRMSEAKSGEKMGSQAFVTEEEAFRMRYEVFKPNHMGSKTTSVIRTIDKKTNKPVIVRFFKHLDDFKNEVKILQLCDPDYVHALVDHLEDPQATAHAIVIEQGTMTLRNYIDAAAEEGTIERNERKAIIDRVAKCVEHLHNHNYIHCELRPENVMLFGHKWKLTDLRTARPVGKQIPDRKKQLFQYMPPERALAEMNNAESQMRIVFSYDMWQLGCIMYELFVLAPLISKNEADPLARLVAFSRHDIKVDDVQAQHLLQDKLLVKEPIGRVNIAGVLVSFVLGSETLFCRF